MIVFDVYAGKYWNGTNNVIITPNMVLFDKAKQLSCLAIESAEIA